MLVRKLTKHIRQVRLLLSRTLALLLLCRAPVRLGTSLRLLPMLLLRVLLILRVLRVLLLRRPVGCRRAGLAVRSLLLAAPADVVRGLRLLLLPERRVDVGA